MAVRTEGAYIYTADNRRIVDAISSWWVITHGHRHPRIVEAIKAQADVLDQLIFAEFTHEAAARVAAKVLAVAPRGLEHVFFSDSRLDQRRSRAEDGAGVLASQWRIPPPRRGART